jgi:hypothetical protein
MLQYEGKAIVVDFDPRWVVEVEVTKVLQGGESASKRKKICYAIHSPTMKFATSAEECEGKVFKFQETMETEDNNQKRFHLTAEPVQSGTSGTEKNGR